MTSQRMFSMRGKPLQQQLFASGLRAATLALRFGLMFMLARKLTPSDVGLFGLYWAGLQMAASLLTLDIYSYTSKQILSPLTDRPSVIGRHIGAIFVFALVLAPISAILFFNSSSSITRVISGIFLFHLVFEVFSTDIGRLLIPLGRPLFSNLVLFVRSALWVFPLVVWMEFDVNSIGVLGVIIFWLAGSFIGVVLSIFYARAAIDAPIVPKINFEWIRGALIGSGFFLVGTLLFRAVLGLDRFVVESVLGLESVGVYGLYASVCLGVLGLLESGVSAWRYPELVRNIQRSDGSAARVSLAVFVRQNSLASLFLISVVALFFPLVIRLYLGSIYFDDIAAFFAIVIGVFIYCLSMPFHYVIYGFQKDFWFIVIYGFAFVVLAFWALYFMKPLGVLGGGIMLALALSAIALGRFVIARILMRKLRCRA